MTTEEGVKADKKTPPPAPGGGDAGKTTGEAQAGKGEVEGAPPGTSAPPGTPLPTLDFTTLILSLSSSALMNLGVIENPVTKAKDKEPAAAKQTIDLIALLQEKTAGNLSGEESKLTEDVLTELRLWYCKVVE